ncbi:MAG: L-threonylcarbamoyladenylate synthase [Verrucomicrobia bacterium]|nr:L-threonylcarbamoyladenylate synthase [Verrucomicrobiota bacterium]
MAVAVEELKAGGVVALPTETVYGLAADAFNAEAVAKIFEVKKRPSFDPLIVHLARAKDLAKVAVVPEELQDLVKKLTKEFWPGPLTLVLPKTEAVPDIVTSGLPTVAVRISKHEVMRGVAKELGNPIAAPSANIFGRISPTSASAVLAELGGRIPLVVDGGACGEGIESTIVAVDMDGGKPVLWMLRPGPVTREDLRKFARVAKPKEGKGQVAAPGQLESHYAPRTPLLLFEKPEDFVPEEGKTYGLLSYRGEEKDGYVGRHEWAVTEIMSPGSGKMSEAAVRLFHLLRKLDESGVDAIVAEPVSTARLGAAVMDRLRKAAGSAS